MSTPRVVISFLLGWPDYRSRRTKLVLKFLAKIATCIVATAGTWQCASIPNQPTIDYSTSFMKALCEMRADENISENRQLKLVGVTRPVVDIFSLRLLYDPDSINASSIALDERQSEQLVEDFQPRSIVLPEGKPTCGIELAVMPIEELYYSDHLIIQVSNPVANGFSDEFDSGVFVRFSVGGFNHASWYWFSPVPTTSNNAVIVHPLEITEM